MMKFVAAWFPMALLAYLNGTVRQFLYAEALGDLRAHQVSSVSIILLFTLYMWVVFSRWPPQSSAQALQIGALWVVLTVAFEFGFGLFVAGYPLDRLLHDYDLLAGRIWLLVLVWIALGPLVVSRLMQPVDNLEKHG